MGHMEAVRRYYGVPAQRGGIVEYTGDDTPRRGVILSARDLKLYIEFFPDSLLERGRREGPFHPTWALRYVRPDC